MSLSMNKKILVLCCVLFVLAFSAPHVSGKTRGDVLGISPGMSRDAVHGRVQKMGKLEREEHGRQEVWSLKDDARFASLLIGYDGDYRVRYVTALARDAGRRMRYTEIGELKEAHAEKTAGFSRYTWEVKPGREKPGYYLIAQGRDPQYLTSLSVKRSGQAVEDDDDEDAPRHSPAPSKHERSERPPL